MNSQKTAEDDVKQWRRQFQLAKPDAAERLKKVKSLFDQGLINKEEYDKKVKEIMDSL